MTTEKTKQIKIKFNIRPDITAFELAHILQSYIVGTRGYTYIPQAEWDKFDQSTQKHFEVLP